MRREYEADLEETPLMDFLMGLSGYMELMAAGAALLLTLMVAM